MSRVTIKDIARLVKVNPSTVSRALKDHPDISEDTKQKIREVAEELGYRPNFQAIHFRNRRSGLIGLIIPEMGVFFLPSVIKAIEEASRENGYNLIVFQSNDYLEREMEIARICHSFGVDGLLVSLSQQTRDIHHLTGLVEDGVPVVIFDRMLENQSVPTVGIYDQQAAANATAHLARKGYRRIAGIFGHPDLAITRQRLEGFRSALQHFGLPIEEELTAYAGDHRQAKTCMQSLMDRPGRPDAVFVMSDDCLVGVMQMVYEQRVRVPEEVAIIAISDGDLPHYLNPKITHILHSGYEVGKNAALLLLEMMQEKANVPSHVRLETELVELGSV